MLVVGTAQAAQPDDPTNLTQADSHGTIASSGVTNDTTVTLGADLTDSDSGDTVQLRVEVQPAATGFTDTPTGAEGSFSAQGTHTLNVTSLAPGTYHWQAQSEDQGSNVSGWTAGDTFRVNAQPNDPTSLAQKSDGNVSISPGGVTNDNTPTFSGIVTDPDNNPTQTDTLQLEVEVKPAGSANFDGTDTFLSSSVNDNQTASATTSTLAPGTYHWRARTVDVNNGKSNWVNFGATLTVTDFRVNAPPNNPASTTQKDSLGVTIPPSGVTNDTTVKLGANLTDPDSGDNVKLLVEVRPVATSFSDTATESEGSLTAQGIHTLNVTRSPGTYHWQAQAEDENSAFSAGWTAGGAFRINAPPNDPTSLAQKSDGNVAISPGGVTNDNTPTFSGIVTDPDNNPTQTDTLQLEVEVKPAGSANFDGSNTFLSTSVNDNQTASATTSTLAPGTYHWRARTVDVNNGKSNWVNFGATVTVTDFRVNAPPNAPGSTTQKDSSGVTIASPNGITNDTTVKLGATLSDPDVGDSVKLLVEVQPVVTGFSNTATNQEGSFTAQGLHTLNVTLSPGTYHWQAQTEDEFAAFSGWTAGGTFRINAPPNNPTSPDQKDSIGSITPVGAKTNDNSITFTGAVTDPDNSPTQTDTIAIQVEVEPLSTGFTNAPTATGTYVTNSQTSTVTVSGLLFNADYHWQFRAIDINGGVSAWTDFGSNEPAKDFRIRQADLSLTQSFTPSPAKASATTSSGPQTRSVTIDLILTNNGPDEATGVTITDALDSTILDTSPSSAKWCLVVTTTCTPTTTYTGSINVGTLNPGTETYRIAANVKTSPSPLIGGPLTLSNLPTVTSPTHDNVPGNNSPTTPTDDVQTVPAPPTDVHTASGNTNAVVNWSVPTNSPPTNGGTTITQYRIVATPQTTQPATCTTTPTTVVRIASGASTIALDTGANSLKNGCVYDVTVQSESAVGLSVTASSDTTANPSLDKSAAIFSATNQSQQTGATTSSTDPLIAQQQTTTTSFQTGSIGTIEELSSGTNAYGIDPSTFCGGLKCVAGEVVVTKVTDDATGRYLVDIYVAKGVAIGTGNKTVYFDPTPGNTTPPFDNDTIVAASCPKKIPADLTVCISKLVATPAQNPALRVELSVRKDLTDPAAGVRK